MGSKKLSQRGHAGRPVTHNLDVRQVKELAKIQCTMKEIAAVMGCSVDTLERDYADLIKDGREAGKTSLRRAQWEKAINDKNPALLIWLGRFYLDQREEISINAGSETEVKKLLDSWEISAKKKTSFDKIHKPNVPSRPDEQVLAA
jgi:hypothetical protein